MIELPPMRITQGVAKNYEFTWSGQDLSTGWTGTTVIKEKIGGDTVLSEVPTLGATGLVTVGITATEASNLTAKDRIGFFHTGWFEVSLVNNADATLSEVFQGQLFVAGAI